MASTTQTLSKSGKSSRRGIDPLSIILVIAAILILGLLVLDLTLLPTGSKPAAQPVLPQTSGQQAAPTAQAKPADQVAPTVIPTVDTSSVGDY